MNVQMQLLSVEQAANTSDDYYTPKYVFDTLGLRFDVDVCAPPGGVPWIPTDLSYSLADDGLSQPWFGRVWMNPPYSDVTPWWRRFADHRNGVALLPIAKSYWLNAVWREADAVAIGDQGGEMLFFKPGRPEKPVRIWFPVLFAAFGKDCVDAISKIGQTR